MHGDQSSRSQTGSFGSGMRRIDAAEDPQALLTFLDDVAELDEFRNAKQRATETLSLRPGDRVLEVGCGTGVDLPALVAAVKPGGRVAGIDLSERAVDQAKLRMAAVPEAEMLVADAHELPFPSESFEACRVDRTMLHLAAPERALAELRRVLTAGGRLVINESGSRLDGNAAVLETAAHKAISARYWHQHEKVAQIALFLPLLMSRVGFVDIRPDRVAAQSSDFGTADRILRLNRDIRGGRLQAGTVSRDAAQRCLDDIRAAMESGDVLLRHNSVMFFARAPA